MMICYISHSNLIPREIELDRKKANIEIVSEYLGLLGAF
jgi:hypothetical protein